MPNHALQQGHIRIGVIGGGQLARMMVPPAIHLGLDISVLAESEGMSANRATDQVGDYRNLDTVLAFAETVDALTFDHEHVPQHILRELVARGHQVHPNPDALQFAQDKLDMRAKLSELDVPMPEWAEVTTEAELARFMADHAGAAVIKTPRGGYDGKGVRVVREAQAARDWFTALNEDGRGGSLLVEELVEFRRELSQLIARNPSGDVRAWPVVETVQRDGVCAEVLAPAPDASDHIVDSARVIGEQIAGGLGVTGVLAVELFETVDGRVLVNELAMRPHNSGHFSIEGSVTSQFEQHLRAVADLPLGSTEMVDEVAVMVNVLGGPSEGSMPVRYAEVLRDFPDVHVHSYGKEPRPGRKVGHVTAVGATLAETQDRARAAASAFDG